LNKNSSRKAWLGPVKKWEDILFEILKKQLNHQRLLLTKDTQA
jgi:hypothetical protein